MCVALENTKQNKKKKNNLIQQLQQPTNESLVK